MTEEIELKSRYGDTHRLVPMEEYGENVYKLKPAEDWMPVRYIFNGNYDAESDVNELVAVDTDGGPYLSVGNTVSGKKIERIYNKKGVGALIVLK